MKIMKDKPIVVYVDDEPENLSSFRLNFINYYDVEVFDKPSDFLKFIENQNDISVIICDYRMPEMDGVQLLMQSKKFLPETRRIILSAYDDSKILLDAINKAQIHKYILKPWTKEGLLETIEEQIEFYELIKELNKKYEELKIKNLELLEIKRILEEENKFLKSENKFSPILRPRILNLNDEDKIIIVNPVLNQIYMKIEKLKDVLDFIFITGEKGSGKKTLIKFFLKETHRIKNKNMIVLDCFILKENFFSQLIENVYKKNYKENLIYIKNMEELSNEQQEKLLILIEDKKVYLNNEVYNFDQNFFVISSNLNLEMLSSLKIFEKLILYLSSFHFHIPSLRFRKDELPHLLEYYVDFFSKKNLKNKPTIPELTINYLLKYKWPGNIDELKKNIQSAVLLSDTEILPEHFFLLPNYFYETLPTLGFGNANVFKQSMDIELYISQLDFMKTIIDFKNNKISEINYEDILDKFEKFVIEIALEKSGGNKAKAANLLNIKTGKFLYKTKFLGL